MRLALSLFVVKGQTLVSPPCFLCRCTYWDLVCFPKIRLTSCLQSSESNWEHMVTVPPKTLDWMSVVVSLCLSTFCL